MANDEDSSRYQVRGLTRRVLSAAVTFVATTSAVSYWVLRQAYKSFYGAFGLTLEEAGLQHDQIVGTAVITGLLFLLVLACLGGAFIAGYLFFPADPAAISIRTAFVTIGYFGVVLGAALTLNKTLATDYHLIGIALLMSLGITVSIVHREHDGMLRQLFKGIACGVGAGVVAGLWIEFVQHQLGTTWAFGAGAVAFLGLTLLADRLLKSDRHDVEEMIEEFAPAARALIVGVLDRTSRVSRSVVAMGISGLIVLALIVMYHWERWSDGQYAVAVNSIRLGYVDPRDKSILLETNVRPVKIIPIGGKDPQQICSNAHPYAASLVGSSGGSNWVLLRSIHARSWRVVALESSDYTIDLTPDSAIARASAKQSKSGRSVPWETPACSLS